MPVKQMMHRSSTIQIMITVSLMVVVLTGFSSIINAEELSLSEVIDYGKENNFEIMQKRESLKSIEREMAVLKAGLDWQLGLSGNISQIKDSDFKLTYNQLNPDDALNNPDKNSGSVFGITLKGGKTTPSGISISSELSLTETDPLQFKNLDDKYEFKLDISKRLYPVLPDETEKSIIKGEKNYLITEAELKNLCKQKEIDWLESYLNLLRFQQQLECADRELELTREELERVKDEQSNEEAGQEQLLVAEISVKEAILQKNQLQTDILQTRKGFLLELGLNNDDNQTDLDLNLDENEEYINRVRDRAADITADLSRNDMVELLKENNVQLRKIESDIDYAEKELRWQLKEDDIKLDASTSYEYNAAARDDKDNYSLNLGLSYDFIDGGQQELKVQGIKSEIDNLKKRYKNTLEQLKIELDGLISEQKTNELNLDMKKTTLEKARLEHQLYRRQFNEGLIDKIKYEQSESRLRQAEVEYSTAGDNLLISRLRTALLLGLY